jgi:molybdopterin/thiamine biosynthesis adenylyltransferase
LHPPFKVKGAFIMRYERQLLLPQIGESGQGKLAASVVTVVGCGGLGSPVLTYLACAGVGTLRIIDCDTVSESNLNRQFLHGEQSIGMEKTASAMRTLRALNTGIRIEAHQTAVSDDNIGELIEGSDAVVDCADNVATRLTVDRGCIRAGIPLVEGGINGFSGFVMCVDREHACLGCLGYDRAVGSGPRPVLGATAGVIGSLQAMECLKLLLGAGEPLFGTLLQYDGLTGSFERIPVSKYARCVCHGPF